MDYKMLLKATELYHIKYEDRYVGAYAESRRTTDWSNLHRLQTEEIKKNVLSFLNKWQCRIPRERANRVANEIRNVHGRTLLFLECLDGERLEGIDFTQKKEVEGKHLEHSSIIKTVFSEFSKIGDKFRCVAASKVLHMINPRLFVMWDNPIGKEGYNLRLTPHSYAYKFMPQMQEEINEAINTFMSAQNCSRNAVIDYLENHGTLPKLVDEYNFLFKRSR